MALAPTRDKRRHHLLLAPEQRQRRRDHAGAQHAEQRDDAVDGVGKLHRHHGIGLQAEPAQPGGERRNGAVGLRIGQPPRRAAGEARAVGRIDQRQRVGAAHAGAAEQVVERGAVAACLLSVCRRGSFGAPCHQVSGR